MDQLLGIRIFPRLHDYSEEIPCSSSSMSYVHFIACKYAFILYKKSLFDAGFVAAHTLPVLYERYDDQIDNFIYKVLGQLQHNYRKLDARVLSKVPTRRFTRKKSM